MFKNNPVFTLDNKFQKIIKHIVIVSSLLIYWYFGFYPFKFQLPIEIQTNAVSHPAADGFHFKGPGIGYTIKPPVWLESAIANSKLDIKLEFKTESIYQLGPARILTMSKDPHNRNLTIGQDGPDLVLRIRTQLSNQNGYPPFRLKNVLKDNAWQQLQVSISPDKLNVVLNDAEKISNYLPHNPMSAWSPDYQLVIGNELTNDRPWQGKIRHIVIESGDQIVDYATQGILHFPKNLILVNVAYNLIPFTIDSLDFKSIVDWIVNLFGFAPFGFLIMFFSTSRLDIIKAMALCALLSLSIEIGQLFIARRVTEIEDVILNTFGGLLGAFIGRHYRQIEQANVI